MARSSIINVLDKMYLDKLELYRYHFGWHFVIHFCNEFKKETTDFLWDP